MNKSNTPTANRDSTRLELSPTNGADTDLGNPGSIHSDSANLESIKLIDEPEWDEVSGEVTFDDRGNAVWAWQTKDHAAAPDFKEDRDDSILKHIDIEDLRIIETSDLKHTGTLSGKLELGQRFRDRSDPGPTRGLFSWLQKETGNAANARRPTGTASGNTAQDPLDMTPLSLDSPALDPLVRDFVNKHMADLSAPRRSNRREPEIDRRDPLPVLTSPISREQLTRKPAPAPSTTPVNEASEINGGINRVNRAAMPSAKPAARRTEPAASQSTAPTLAAMLERMGRR